MQYIQYSGSEKYNLSDSAVSAVSVKRRQSITDHIYRILRPLSRDIIGYIIIGSNIVNNPVRPHKSAINTLIYGIIDRILTGRRISRKINCYPAHRQNQYYLVYILKNHRAAFLLTDKLY